MLNDVIFDPIKNPALYSGKGSDVIFRTLPPEPPCDHLIRLSSDANPDLPSESPPGHVHFVRGDHRPVPDTPSPDEDGRQI